MNPIVGTFDCCARAATGHATAAPRSMKMGTTRSRFPYDAAAYHASQLAKVQYPSTLHSASRTAAFPIWQEVRFTPHSRPLEKQRDRRHVLPIAANVLSSKIGDKAD
jgi:hypothetical protein